MALTLRSTTFRDGASIPKECTGEGQDSSPELHWLDPPPGTQEFALVCDDPDAPTDEPWVHWVVYGMPVTQRQLPAGLAKGAHVPGLRGLTQGRNSWGKTGYGGPLPPVGHGPHHYHFTLYASRKPLGLEEGLGKDDVLRAIRPHLVGEARLVGIYERKAPYGKGASRTTGHETHASP